MWWAELSAIMYERNIEQFREHMAVIKDLCIERTVAQVGKQIIF